MKAKWVILAVSAAFFALVVHSDSEAVNIRDIDTVRNKPVLDNKDLQIIDVFMDEAVRELVGTRDFASIAQARSIILTRRTSRKSSAQAQYAEQFSESAHKYISSGLKQAEKLTPKDRRFKMVLNLLILIDGLEDVRLANLAMGLLKDESKVIRYWAVHSVTSPGFTNQLNSTMAVNSQLARSIVEQLQMQLGLSGPETLALMAEFAAEVSIPQGEDLLGRIAEMRIKKYADWTVDYEPLDGVILELLYKKIFSGAVNKPAVARRFGQLYSHVIQRYVKGRDILNADQKHQLASVLVETEKSCITKLLGAPQTVIKVAVERNDYTRLLLEHSRILGDATKAGQLPQKLNFDYGTNPNGTARTAPLALPEPPQKSTPGN
ncbi:MAG: hypothetical protein OEW48_13765 [Phycisphaerae bacterium]|nr:hypothetical protein [Phycisphaerae bacterium]